MPKPTNPKVAIAASNEIRSIETDHLDFDPENPRFYRLTNSADTNLVIEEMIDDEAVQDLMRSIGEKGYFAGEPLLVTYDETSEKFIVVEGNRRLAAVKLLNGQISPPDKRVRSVQVILNEAKEAPPTSLPCIVYNSRKDVLRYLGYRHITGVKEWDALSKAKYLEDLRQQFYTQLSEPEQFKALANDIGSRSDYVAKLLTALNLYQNAADSRPAFFGLNIRPDDVEFSYITTALGYSNISIWLGLTDGRDTKAEGLIEENLKRMFGWMFVKDSVGNTVLGESRNLSDLAEIVGSGDALPALIESNDIAKSYLYTSGPQKALSTALDQALLKLRVAWDLLLTARPLTSEHQASANDIFDQARLIRNTVREEMDEE